MRKGWMGLVLAGCVALCSTTRAGSDAIFADGFETPCDPEDIDGDRLSGCAELLMQTDPALADTDGDGLSDGDEVLGTLDGLNLPAMGVNARRKDILLEYDWYDDQSEAGFNPECPAGETHSHRPTSAMLDIVTVMFGAAPVPNPNGVPGINVIHDYGQGGLFTGGSVVFDADGDGTVQGSVSGDQYNNHYAVDFAAGRHGYFHYVLMPHRYVASDGKNTYSGVAELSAGIMRDEMIVSLYCYKTTRNVAFTIVHELGHNLGLHHGGNTDCNYKPNYNSLMNYRHQFPGVDVDCDGMVFEGPANYSLGIRNTLDENALDEAVGLCGGVPIDWNGKDGIEPSVQHDVNSQDAYQQWTCGGVLSTLEDYNDWVNIVLDTTPVGNEQGNEPPEVQEPPVCPGPPEATP
jgi:hypothetical protein